MVTVARSKGNSFRLKISRQTLNTLVSVNDRSIAETARMYYTTKGWTDEGTAEKGIGA